MVLVSKTIELPDEVYERIAAEASAAGTTPAEWIAAQVWPPPTVGSSPSVPADGAPRTMADLFAGRVGLVASNGGGRLSQDADEAFAGRTLADMMEGLIGTYSSSGSESLPENHSALF